MGILVTVIALAAYAAFVGRLFRHLFLWLRASGSLPAGPAYAVGIGGRAVAVAAMDLLLFRRLFGQNKLLWIGSWTFHVSFLLVALRHLQYVLEPVPDCIWRIRSLGICAGYILPVSLVFILLLRLLSRKNRYVSLQNYFLLCLTLGISLAGLVMRNYFSPDLMDVKAFVIGILTFSPRPLPESAAFAVHFVLFLVLLPAIPLHMLAAPLVTLEARRRDDELREVMHGR